MDGDIPETPFRPEDPPSRSKHRFALSSTELATGKRRLSDMVQSAFKCLEDAMKFGDYPTAVKAAQIILDRSGFGPRTTMDVNTVHVDLTNLTQDELAARAFKIAEFLKNRDSKVIDIPSRPQ